MGTITNLSERVTEAMTTAYRAELARRPQAIEEAKRVYLALVNPAALADGADASEGALAAVAASLTEYLLFDADIDGERGVLGAYASEADADPDVARLCLELSETVFFSKFLVESQDPNAGTAVLLDLADGVKYEVADAEVASTEGWSRGTLGVWLAEVSDRWLCVSIIPFHDFCRDAEADPAESDYLTLVGRVLGAGGRYASSVRLYAAA